MEEKLNAICIRSNSYKDNDKIITLFSLEKGICDCILRGVKKPGAKLRFAAEVFCFSEYILVEKSGRRTVKEANEIDSFYDLRLDIDRFYCASAITEFIKNFCQTNEVYYDLFLTTLNSLKLIKSNVIPPQFVLVKFYIDALSQVGFGITFDGCGVCGASLDKPFFDFSACVFKCENCHNISDTQIKKSTYKILNFLSSIPIKDLKNIDKSTYSEVFASLDNCLYALKFLDFFMYDKIGVTLKCNKQILNEAFID